MLYTVLIFLKSILTIAKSSGFMYSVAEYLDLPFGVASIWYTKSSPSKLKFGSEKLYLFGLRIKLNGVSFSKKRKL